MSKLEKKVSAPPLGIAKMAETSVTDLEGSPPPSSPASLDGPSRRFSFQSFKTKARRSLSIRKSVTPDIQPLRRQSTSAAAHERSQSLNINTRRLSKSQRVSSMSSFSPMAPFAQRASGLSDDSSDTSSLVPSSTSSSSEIEWPAQIVEKFGMLDADTESVRAKPSVLAVTSGGYLVKLKCRADALGLFPGLAKETETEPVTPNPTPLLVIPLSDVVSVFEAESTRPSFGLEVWWRAPSGDSFLDASFWFKYPEDREEYRRLVQRKAKASQNDTKVWQPPPDVLDHLQSIHGQLEPAFAHQAVKVFPVVPRGPTRALVLGESEDRQKEKPSFWLVFGEYLCHIIAVQRTKPGEFKSQHKSYGFVSLERIKGNHDMREERFYLTFRVPCCKRTVIELSSRFYSRIIVGFGKVDSLLKPAWPPVWQLTEFFQVRGLGDVRFVARKDDFGSIRRTLNAYLAAFQCSPVNWEINWKAKFSPEFRLLPAKDGSTYTAYQLLAVLRALRYNDYFNSLSFKNVDLSPLWGVHDLTTSAKGQVAYMNRSCLTLSEYELHDLLQSPLLHQEFHALAFCSETIRRIDFTKSAARFGKAKGGWEEPTRLEFLTPILTLLRSGSTRCNHLLLSGNALRKQDVDDIAETLAMAAIQALDVSSCGLGEKDLDILTKSIRLPNQVQLLDISKNRDRLPATHLPNLLAGLVGVKELNLRASLRVGFTDAVESLVPFSLLQHLQELEVLDISGLKINSATLDDLARYVRHRATAGGRVPHSNFRKLAMDHCGLSGAAVAKFCTKIEDVADMTLSVSGNPLDEGLDRLCDAVRWGRAPSGLIMEMVTFRNETEFVNLIEALTVNKSISLLSLAGTSTLDTSDEPCSKRLIQTLHNLFARNNSIHYLDISGYSGKLEDGHFAKGFARSLSGLLSNKAITHLKIRSQNLSADDIALLGRVMAENRALRVVDCQDNGINLTGIRFLVSSVQANERIVDLPFSPGGRHRMFQRIVDDMIRNSYGGLASSAKKNPAMEKAMTETKAALEEMFTATFCGLHACLQRHRTALRDASGQLLDFDPSSSSLEEMRRTWLMLAEAGGADQTGGCEEVSNGGNWPRATFRSSQLALDTCPSVPYNQGQGNGTAISTETVDDGSGATTPHEAVTPTEDNGDGGGFVYDKLGELRATRMAAP